MPSFYLDLGEIHKYLGNGDGARAYHHTAPVGLVHALDVALDLVLEECLEARFQRHAAAQALLIERLAPLGLEPLVRPHERLWPLTTARLPKSLDEAAVRRQLIQDHDVEIGGGLGPLAGTVWRFGFMGIHARSEVVERLVSLLGPAMQAARSAG